LISDVTDSTVGTNLLTGAKNPGVIYIKKKLYNKAVLKEME